MKTIKNNILVIFHLLTSGLIYAQNPIDRVLPADSYFYNPIINTANQMSFPNGDTSTSALQTMINSLSNSGGGVLIINAGTYILGQIDMKTGVHIRVHPNVVFKTTPQGALFQAGYDNGFANANNWSFQSTNGEKFTFDFSDMLPNENIRAFQLGNTHNFKLADFLVLDNYTKFNAVSSGAVGDTNQPALFAKFGIIENLDIKKAHYGYGLIQCQVGQDILFRNLSGEGGVTLRLESGFSGLADLYVTDKTPIIKNIYGRNITATNAAHAVMLSPHTITQGMVDIRDITGISCEAAVSVNNGFLSSDKGQSAPDHTAGTFSEESVITNIFATYGTEAQVRAARLRHIPCALRNYISAAKNPDDESYKAPSLAPVYYLAIEDYVSKGNPAGRYKIVLENVTHSGFSSEIRADGLITDSGLNDFEGCDIDGSPIWIAGADKNTPNPLQTSYTAEPLSVQNFINEDDIVVYQEGNSKELIVKSNLNATIKIYNLIGQLLKKVSKSETKISINVSDIPKNIYLIHIESHKKTIIKKIIIE
jgi:hypothetical protein